MLAGMGAAVSACASACEVEAGPAGAACGVTEAAIGGAPASTVADAEVTAAADSAGAALPVTVTVTVGA